MKRNWRYNRPLFSSPQQAKRKRRKWVILPIMWMALKRTCMALGAAVLLSLTFTLIVTYQAVSEKAQPLPDQMVLYLEFEGGLSELPAPPNFSDPFAGYKPTLRELVAVIDKAALDERVEGIYARLKPGAYSYAQVQELRDALMRFRAFGKFAYIYAQSYGDINGGMSGYYLASAFEEIWMQPMGVVSITGLNFQAPYLRQVLDTIGVEPQFFQRKEYKTAYEALTNKEMSPQNREMMESLLSDIRAELKADIPTERGFSKTAFEKHVNYGLFTAQTAEDVKLISKAGYADTLVKNIKALVLGDPESKTSLFVTVGGYLNDMKQRRAEKIMETLGPKKPKVALVYAVGAIMPTKTGNGIAAADEIAPAIIAAAQDDTIQAIVLRVDSPGGSPTASESILRAVERAQDKGKLVIVTMGSTAASGGYWISAYADQIFVQPTTVTGSIGVLGGKVSLAKLSETLGINWQGVKWGENADLWSLLGPYSDIESARVNAMLDQVYDGFIERVARGRNMSPEQVDAIAGGRVWSGAQALEIGLADQLGGLTEALNYTAKQLDRKDKNDLAVIILPAPKTPFQQFLQLLGDSGAIFSNLKAQGELMNTLKPVMHELSVLRDPNLYSVYEPLELN